MSGPIKHIDAPEVQIDTVDPAAKIADETKEQTAAAGDGVALDAVQTPENPDGNAPTDVASTVVDGAVEGAGTSKLELEIAKAGGHNKYTEQLMELSNQIPELADSKFFQALIILAAKYGGLFDAFTSIGDRMLEDEYKDESISDEEANALAGDINDIPQSFPREDSEKLDSVSTKFASEILFGPGHAIDDPIRLAAKLHYGKPEPDGSVLKYHDETDSVKKFALNSPPAGSVVIFSINNKTDKIVNIRPKLTGVVGKDNLIYFFGPKFGEEGADKEIPNSITFEELKDGGKYKFEYGFIKRPVPLRVGGPEKTPDPAVGAAPETGAGAGEVVPVDAAPGTDAAEVVPVGVAPGTGADKVVPVGAAPGTGADKTPK